MCTLLWSAVVRVEYAFHLLRSCCCIRMNIIRTSTLRMPILTASFTLHRRRGQLFLWFINQTMCGVDVLQKRKFIWKHFDLCVYLIEILHGFLHKPLLHRRKCSMSKRISYSAGEFVDNLIEKLQICISAHSFHVFYTFEKSQQS